MLLQVAGVAGFEDQIMFGKGDLEGMVAACCSKNAI
jgi:hypothetical protein